MSPGFSRHQLKKLATELEQRRVHTRQQDGKNLSYIEGWFAIAEANRIFGYDGWDRQMVQCERVFERRSSDITICGYAARVRISVRANGATIVREGSGFGQAAAAKTGDAHERALKAAETDATKRALATFGGRFGLMLYDKQRKSGQAGGLGQERAIGIIQASALNGSDAAAGSVTSSTATVSTALAGDIVGPVETMERRSASGSAIGTAKDQDGKPPTTQVGTDPAARIRPSAALVTQQSFTPSTTPRPLASYQLMASDGSATTVRSAESFCSALRQLVDVARDPDEIMRLAKNNAAVITALRSLPELKTTRGERYADVLERLLAKRAEELKPAREPSGGASVAATELDRRAASNVHDIQDGDGPSAADIESAVAEDVPADANALPPVFKPFVPVPAYPLAKVAQRFSAASQPSALGRASWPPVDSAERSREQIALASSQDAAPIGEPANQQLPTRRSQITGVFAIDKSALLLPSERRLRSKAHLIFVASKPCLVCEALPCHAHHITFAQPRGLSQKVSDEFTVPLCAVHHNELHAFGNEASWWRAQGIEPMAVASVLWRETVTLTYVASSAP